MPKIGTTMCLNPLKVWCSRKATMATIAGQHVEHERAEVAVQRNDDQAIGKIDRSGTGELIRTWDTRC